MFRRSASAVRAGFLNLSRIIRIAAAARPVSSAIVSAMKASVKQRALPTINGFDETLHPIPPVDRTAIVT
jgi:hypothetical protein